MSELKIPDDLNTRYKLAKAQLAILPSIDDDLADLFLGTRYQCEEVIQLIERIAALEAENAALKAPVSDEEWLALCSGDVVTFADVLRRDVDALIANRVKETP